MRLLQSYLAISLAVCVVGAIYLSFREVALPEVSRIDRTLTEGEPRQEPSDRPAFTALIKGYTYTLTPRATYEISGLVVSQHRGDALFNLDHTVDPGNIRDVCVVWGESITNGFTGLSVVARGNHLRADAGRYAWYASLAVLVALGAVWFVRPPLAE